MYLPNVQCFECFIMHRLLHGNSICCCIYLLLFYCDAFSHIFYNISHPSHLHIYNSVALIVHSAVTIQPPVCSLFRSLLIHPSVFFIIDVHKTTPNKHITQHTTHIKCTQWNRTVYSSLRSKPCNSLIGLINFKAMQHASY